MSVEFEVVIKFVLVFAATLLVKIYGTTGGVGGGRLVLFPFTLFLFGLDPSVLVATLKFGSIGNVGGVREFYKHKTIDWKMLGRVIIWTLIGTSIGSYFVISVEQELLKKILSTSILAILLIQLFLFYRHSKKKNRSTNRYWLYITSLLSAVTGAIIGFKGVIMRSLYLAHGLNQEKSNATNKATGLIGNALSVLIYWQAGIIDWPIAITMFFAAYIGSVIGARLSKKVGENWLKWIFITSAAIGAIIMFLK